MGSFQYIHFSGLQTSQQQHRCNTHKHSQAIMYYSPLFHRLLCTTTPPYSILPHFYSYSNYYFFWELLLLFLLSTARENSGYSLAALLPHTNRSLFSLLSLTALWAISQHSFYNQGCWPGWGESLKRQADSSTGAGHFLGSLFPQTWKEKMKTQKLITQFQVRKRWNFLHILLVLLYWWNIFRLLL